MEGPYLVRSAIINKHGLELTGDIANATTISIFGPRSAVSSSVRWNGKKLKLKQEKGGVWSAQIDKARPFKLPSLDGWKYTDDLPEIDAKYAPSSKAWIGKAVLPHSESQANIFKTQQIRTLQTQLFLHLTIQSSM